MPSPAYPPAAALTQPVAFGAVHILPGERRLLVQGRPAPLGARAFDLLLVLAARRERVVGKDELLDLVWPGVVVEENNLAAQISALRKVLGAQAISTVPGRGYRFTLAPALPTTPMQGGDTPVSLRAEGLEGLDGLGGLFTAGAVSEAGHLQPTSAPAAAARAGTRLLLAEDNKVNRLLLCRTLELQGWQVSTADNGRQALALLRQQHFALLLLDLEMPELDGFALLQLRSEDPALQRTPVIVTSSLDGVGPVARCIELGADDYLHKPVNATLLRTRVGACLERAQLRAQRDQLLLALQQQQQQQQQQPRSPLPLMAPAGGGQAGWGSETLPGLQHCAAVVLVLRLLDLDGLLQAQAPEDTRELLNNWHTLMLDALPAHGGQLQLATGDSLTVLFKTDAQTPPEPASPQRLAPARRAVQASRDMAEMLGLFNAERRAAGRLALHQGLGLASGELLLAGTGTPQQPVHACLGAPVQRAQRLAAQALPAGVTALLDAATQQALAGALHPPLQAHSALAALQGSLPGGCADGPVFAAPAPG